MVVRVKGNLGGLELPSGHFGLKHDIKLPEGPLFEVSDKETAQQGGLTPLHSGSRK
jgi:hypothetical protein